MRFPLRTFLGIFAGLFLASTIGMSLVFADLGDLPCPPFCGPPPSDQVTFTIRDGSTIISSGSANLPAAGSPDVSITPTTGAAHDAPARSVLAILKNIESATTTFSVSDLQYSDAFSSFYLNCIAAPADPASPLCGNWQYVVNGVSPGVGMDVQTLSNNDIVYLYFGPSRQITPSTANVTIGVSFTVLAESYVASSDSWTPAVGFTMRILEGDPFGSPTIISSATTGADGTATFTINAAGSYTAGLAEDFYFPNAAITASATPQPAPVIDGGGGLNLHSQFDIPLALAFLEKAQRADGSFDSVLLSDWAAIAFAGGGAGDAKSKLAQYFIANPPVLESITDYERHAMALQALGINPYSAATSSDYITPIVNAFDGTQVGDASLVNDDIFALFPLLHAGYGASDTIIQKTSAFIISRQAANGSWEGSVDMTAAAIQALSLVRQLPDVLPAIVKATDYLHAKQQANGGFGNSFATSWAQQAIAAISDSQINWIQGYSSPQYYLATLQQTDGGVEPASANMHMRVWATEYAIPGVTGKTWDSLLSSFNPPAIYAETAEIATTTPVAPAAAAPEIQVTQAAVSDEQRTAVSELQAPEGATTASVSEDAAPSVPTTTEDAPLVPAESTSPPKADPPLAETTTGTQAAAVATVSSSRLPWLLVIILIILVIILAVLGFQNRFRKRRQSLK